MLDVPGAPKSPSSSSYGALARVKGFPGLVVSQLLGRVAGRMLGLSLVLFVLARYHSPQLAGAATFLLLFPGLLLSPIAGALLDRHGRTRLITLDYLVAAMALFSIAILSARHLLAAPLLLGICGVASLTGPLSWAGLRSMFPSVVPGHLWERANALDLSSDVLATVVGAPLGGVLVGFVGGEWALATAATLFTCAGLAMLRVHDPAIKRRDSGVLAQAWSGLTYVLRNRSLVGLALTFIASGAGWGMVVIAMPVLVLSRLHQGPAVVGYILGAMGAAGLVAPLVVGRMNTEGRERQLMAGSLVAMAAALRVPSPRVLCPDRRGCADWRGCGRGSIRHRVPHAPPAAHRPRRLREDVRDLDGSEPARQPHRRRPVGTADRVVFDRRFVGRGRAHRSGGVDSAGGDSGG